MGGRLQAAAETVSNVCDSEYTRNVPLRLVKTHSKAAQMALQCDSSVSHKLSINFDIIGRLTSFFEAFPSLTHFLL